MDWNIQLFKLNYDLQESKAVTDVIDSGWLTMGEKTNQFEVEFGHFLGGRVKCVAVSNGTAALHMALLAVGVKVGDEVIIPALTFVADINVVQLVGATPRLADSTSIDDWNISAENIKKQITSKTKAVILVHYAGYPCKDIIEISELCRARGISLIEDVAHAPGASINQQMCGTFGDVGCFSFFSNKNLSVGEGGMASSSNAEIVEKLKLIRSHGMTSLTLDRHKGRAISYDVACSGLNYRMDEIRSAIGSVQLEKLPAANAKRKELTERYRSNLTDSSITIPFSAQGNNAKSVYHILPVLLPKGKDRISIIQHLKSVGIQSSIHYPPFWNFTAYKDHFSPGDTPVTAMICNHQLTLPLFPTMTIDQVDVVTKALLEVLA